MKIIVFVLLLALLSACKNNPASNDVPLVTADSLANNLAQFTGKKIALEGKVIHVCPVQGQKMKLLCSNKMIVKILPDEAGKTFDRSWNGKRIKVQGTVREIRLPKSYVDSIEAAGVLLCHIDHTPCLDTAWIAAKHRQGVAEQIVKKDAGELNNEMQNTGKDYISVITLVADKIDEIEIVTEQIETAQNNQPDNNQNGCVGCPLCGLCFAKNL